MKKQYLIGLLSLVAISIPLGNSLLSSTNNQMLQTNNNTMVYDGNQELEETTNPFVEVEPDIAPTITITENNDDLTPTQLETQYEIHYAIDPGTTNGKTNVVNEVDWIDPANPDENFGETEPKTNNPVGPGGIVSGNFKAKNLAPYTEYNTQIKVIFKDDTEAEFAGKTSNYKLETAAHEVKAPVITSTIENKTETAATINYTIDPGEDTYNEDFQIESVKLTNEKGDLFGGTEINTDSKTKGSFEATGLTPDTTYNTQLVVTYVDSKGSSTDPVSGIDWEATTEDVKVTTIPHPTVDPELTTTLGKLTETTAEINYVIDPGEDSHNKPYEIEKVEWTGVNEDLEGTAFPSIEPDTSGKTSGSFTATGLGVAETYDTTITVTFENSPELTQDVEVTTKEADIESPTIKTINAETTLNSVTFDYEATEGQDYEAKPYFLASIEVFDNENTSMYVEGDENAVVADKLDLTGTINIDGLESGTTYEGWTISATFIDTNENYDNSEVEVNDIDPFTTQQDKTGLGWCAIFWITMLVLIIVGIIVWLLTYFYLVFKNRNNFNGEIEEVIIVD